jgi:hypothetical protein
MKRSAVVWVFAMAALVLLPWSVLLATRLPSRHLSTHWDLAWSGFDVALAATLAAVAVCALRHSPWLEGAASAAAASLSATHGSTSSLQRRERSCS